MKEHPRKVKSRMATCICTLMLFFTIVVSISPIGAPTTYLLITPRGTSIQRPLLAAVGETFMVNVTVDDVVDLYSFEFQVRFNATVLDSSEEWITVPAFLNDHNITRKEIDIAGDFKIIKIAVTTTPPADPVSGSGALVTITFNATEVGETKLDIREDKLFDPDGTLISHITAPGYVAAFSTMLLVEPKQNIWDIGESFDINVTIADVENLYGWEFRLNYSTAILTATEVTIVPFLNEPTYEVRKEIDDTLGRVWVSVASVAPALPKSGSGTLVTVTFTVEAVGTSALDLHETKLSNHRAEVIRHGSMSGYFNNIECFFSISPDETISLDKKPGDIFAINVTFVNIVNATPLKAFDFKLRYDARVLNFLNFSLESNFTLTTERIRPDIGEVGFGANTELPRSGNGTVVSITFNITTRGNTILDLYEDQLWDDEGNAILHNTIDGRFMNWRTVSITDYKSNPTSVDGGDLVYFNATIENRGAGIESFNFTLSFESTVHHTEVFHGNSTAKTFMLTHLPIHPSSEHVEIDGVRMERDEDYEINYSSGNLTFYIAPDTSKNATVRYVQYQTDIWETIGTESVYNMPVGGYVKSAFVWNTTGVFPWNISYASPVSYTIIATAATVEKDDYPGDNMKNITVIVRPPAHDIAVLNTVFIPQTVVVGQNVYFQVFVKNLGSKPETFNVTLMYDDSTIGTETNITLLPGYSKLFVFIWDTTGVAPGPYEIKSIASVVEKEIETDNNTHSTQLWVTQPGQPFVMSINLLIVLIVSVMALCVGIVLFLRRRGTTPKVSVLRKQFLEIARSHTV